MWRADLKKNQWFIEYISACRENSFNSISQTALGKFSSSTIKWPFCLYLEERFLSTLILLTWTEKGVKSMCEPVMMRVSLVRHTIPLLWFCHWFLVRLTESVLVRNFYMLSSCWAAGFWCKIVVKSKWLESEPSLHIHHVTSSLCKHCKLLKLFVLNVPSKLCSYALFYN